MPVRLRLIVNHHHGLRQTFSPHIQPQGGAQILVWRQLGSARLSQRLSARKKKRTCSTKKQQMVMTRKRSVAFLPWPWSRYCSRKPRHGAHAGQANNIIRKRCQIGTIVCSFSKAEQRQRGSNRCESFFSLIIIIDRNDADRSDTVVAQRCTRRARSRARQVCIFACGIVHDLGCFYYFWAG